MKTISLVIFILFLISCTTRQYHRITGSQIIPSHIPHDSLNKMDFNISESFYPCYRGSIDVSKNGFYGIIFNADTTCKTDSARIIPYNLKEEDIYKVEKIVSESLEFIVNSDVCKREKIDTAKYKIIISNKWLRQYFGRIKNGDTLVDINAAYAKGYIESSSWKKELIFALGGGASYWRATISLTSNKMVEIGINAPE